MFENSQNNLEFLISILSGFGISGIIAVVLRIIGYFIHENRIDENMSNDELSNSYEEGFDKIIIDQTNVRIQEELSNLSADELKASVIVGVVPAIFGLLAAIAHPVFTQIIADPNWYDLLLVIPFTILLISFMSALKVIFPRTRFDLWEPRDSNNEYASLSLATLNQKLKKERISDFESIRDSRDKDATHLKVGYILLILGSLSLLAITTLISS